MAKVSYTESKADFVIIKFKCNCGTVITTSLIPVTGRYDLNYNDNHFCDNLDCPYCNKKHVLHFYDNMYDAYCEIPSLPDNKDIIYLHEIPYEYAKGYDNAFVDYIEEIVKVKAFVENINNQVSIDKEILYKLAFSYFISIMDAFLSNTFIHNIRKYEFFKTQFVNNNNCRNSYHKANHLLENIEFKSFQNLEKISIPYYKDAFDIDIPLDGIIMNSVIIRNAIIHNNGHEKDGYLYKVTEPQVIELMTHIESLTKFVEMNIRDVIFEKIIIPNIMHS